MEPIHLRFCEVHKTYAGVPCEYCEPTDTSPFEKGCFHCGEFDHLKYSVTPENGIKVTCVWCRTAKFPPEFVKKAGEA